MVGWGVFLGLHDLCHCILHLIQLLCSQQPFDMIAWYVICAVLRAFTWIIFKQNYFNSHCMNSYLKNDKIKHKLLLFILPFIIDLLFIYTWNFCGSVRLTWIYLCIINVRMFSFCLLECQTKVWLNLWLCRFII